MFIIISSKICGQLESPLSSTKPEMRNGPVHISMGNIAEHEVQLFLALQLNYPLSTHG